MANQGSGGGKKDERISTLAMKPSAPPPQDAGYQATVAMNPDGSTIDEIARARAEVAELARVEAAMKAPASGVGKGKKARKTWVLPLVLFLVAAAGIAAWLVILKK